MTQPRVAVIYYSATGTVARLAAAVATGAGAAGAEVLLRRVTEIAPEESIAANPKWAAHSAADAGTLVATTEDVAWADAILLGSPTRFGHITHQAQAFVDSLGALWMRDELSGKVFSAFTSASTPHGGHEVTLLSLYAAFANWGGIIVPPGYSGEPLRAAGTPLGVSQHVSRANPLSDVTLAAARAQGERVATVALHLKAGQERMTERQLAGSQQS